MAGALTTAQRGDDLLEPQFLGLMDDDERQLVVAVEPRVLRVEQPVAGEVAAVGNVFSPAQAVTRSP